ncbi:MAG: heme exporter protein CcmD [Pseudomonadota bacterium]
MLDWLSMGGYGFYVWSSFGLTAVVLFANYLSAIRRHRRILQQLRRQSQVNGREGAVFKEKQA